MKNFQRILIALDHSVFDEKMIRYFNTFSHLIAPEKVHFIYVDHDLEIPPGMEIIYNDEAGNPLSKDELLRTALERKVETGYTQRHGAEVTIDILEGDPLKEILHWVKVKEADLLIVGNKKMSEGSGVMAKKIARHADCAVLFVPETSQENIRKMLVPVDFSDHSKLAMQGAIDLAAELENVEVTAFNTYDVPMTGNPSINLSYERVKEDIKAFKREALEKFILHFDTRGVTLSSDLAVNEKGNPAKQIYAQAVKGSYDLIVIGAKGHSTLERVFLGSVTEKLLGLDKEIPVLVLRK
ncbi:universal stress protein [Flavilitoribacter nigricans]|nr:universal stress protein [Flavilitoribacter nigricans]